ncbi:MAG: LCP family protein [Clostridia bacterium]|nr:LCP family protein [Clostridia bacterium]
MKKIISFIIAVIMVFSLVSCTESGVVEETTTEIITEADSQVVSDLPADTLPEKFAPISDITDASSVKELIKGWATNDGDCMSNRNVMNILLIGEDDVDGSSRSDATILISIDRKSKKITLTSILRDSYTYMNIKGQDRYDKTNHAYAWGGAEKLVEVISANYKIKIDHYAIIDFESFVAAVDEIGGVHVNITQAEADYMNKTSGVNTYKSGTNVKLNGEEALYFARIRKLDGEPERTERQRRLIKAYMSEISKLSMEEAQNALLSIMPYVSTDCDDLELIALAADAMNENWIDFEIESRIAPDTANRKSFNGYQTYTGNLDVWIVDYVKAAQDLQNSIYGCSNITVDSVRNSAIDLANKANY